MRKFSVWVLKWSKWSVWAIIISKRTSGKIPAQVQTKFSVVGSASCRRTWGTWSCRNLMKARFRCWSVRSVRWAVKKALVQTEVMYDKRGVIVVISKSSFLPEEPERRISKGYCRGGRPSSTYLCIYWVGSPIQEH